MSHIWLSRRHLSITRFLNQDISTCTWYTDYWKLMHTMEDITQQRTRGRLDLCFCVLLHSGKTQIMSLCGSFGSYCVSRGFQGLPASQWPTASRVASHSTFNFSFFLLNRKSFSLYFCVYYVDCPNLDVHFIQVAKLQHCGALGRYTEEKPNTCLCLVLANTAVTVSPRHPSPSELVCPEFPWPNKPSRSTQK